MFCSKCGTKAIDGAVFCQKCGAKLNQDNSKEREPVPVPEQESDGEPISSAGLPLEGKFVKEKESIPESRPAQDLSTEPKENSITPVEPVAVSLPESAELLTASDGPIVVSGDAPSDFYSSEAFRRNDKNYGSTIKPYYCAQFYKIEAGEKTNFNWAAFLWGGGNMLYNGCNKLFCMTFLPLLIVVFAGQMLNVLGAAASNSSLVSISLIMRGIGWLCSFVLSIINGLKFNTWYYNDVIKNLEKQRSRKGLWIYLFSVVAVSIIAWIFSAAVPYVFEPANEDIYNDYSTKFSYGDSSYEHTGNIELSETYKSEDEGFSFQYPSSWCHLSESDFEVRKKMIGDGLILEIYSLEDMGDLDDGEHYFASYMQVIKRPLNLTFQGTIDDIQQSLSLIMDEVNVIELSDIKLDGIPARKLIYSFNDYGKTYVVTEYYYAIGSDMYGIRFYTHEKNVDKYDSLFESIVDSYRITVADTSVGNGISDSSNMGEVLYKGIPLGSLFEGSAAQAAELLGLPSGQDRDDDIRLYISDKGEVESIEIWNPGALTMNGENLGKNREGLITILGNADGESYLQGEYKMRYLFENYSLHFELTETEAWRVTVYPVQQEASGGYVSYTMYFEDDTNSRLELYPNGTFCLFANLYEAEGTVIGRYRSNYSVYEFDVTARTFSGFAGDDVDRFEMALEGSTLKYSGDWIGTVGEGSVFRLYACDDEYTVYDSASVFYDDADLPVLGYGLEWVEEPAVVTDDYGNAFISGAVRNTYGSNRSVVNIYFALWDANEYQLSPAIDMIYNFRKGDEWYFNAAVDKNAAYGDFLYVSAY